MADEEWFRPLIPHYIWIGRVASSYAAFELHLDQMIWFLADTPPRIAACLTTQIGNLYAKIRSINALLSIIEGGDVFVAEVNKISERARTLSDKRARIVHDAWGISEDGKIGQIVNAIRGRNAVVDGEERTLEYLKKTQLDINQLMTDTNDLLHRMKAALPPSERKWRVPIDGIALGKVERTTDQDRTT